MPFIETDAYYENTTMREIRDKEDVLIAYDIAPAEGYVLHNVVYDIYEYDSETDEQGELISRGYSSSSSSVESNYDFETNPSEIYAIKKEDLEEDDIMKARIY